MTRDEVGKLGLDVRAHPSGEMGNDFRLVGPYQVGFRGDRVCSVAYVLPGSPHGIVVNGTKVAPSTSAEGLAKLLSNCREPDEREGGTVIICGEGTLIKFGAGSPNVIEVQVTTPDDL